MSPSSKEVDEDQKSERNLDSVNINLPEDFSICDNLTLRRERPSGRSYPLYLQIVEGLGGGGDDFLNEFYVVKGSVSSTEIVAECNSFSEAKLKLVKKAQEESYA